MKLLVFIAALIVIAAVIVLGILAVRSILLSHRVKAAKNPVHGLPWWERRAHYRAVVKERTEREREAYEREQHQLNMETVYGTKKKDHPQW